MSYFENWKANVAEHRLQHWQAMLKASEFGSLAITSAFLVNGGGLLSLPTVLQYLDSAGRAKVPFLAFHFIVGIVAAAAACLFAYINYMSISDAEYYWSEVQAKQLNDPRLTSAPSEDLLTASGISDLKGKIDSANRTIAWTQMLSVGAVLASFAFFAWGSLSAIYLVRDFVSVIAGASH